MKGHVPTPDALADRMVRRLFEGRPPSRDDRILYPGCGKGPFIRAVHRFCEERGLETPIGVGIELDEEHLEDAQNLFGNEDVGLYQRDFLANVDDLGEFEYVIGNPPYVPIEGLEEGEKRRYKRNFETATGRFDLYVLFFEQSLRLLKDGGRLCFVTPEKFEYTQTTEPLRSLLASYHVEEIEHLDEDRFGDLVTYPTVTTVANEEGDETRIVTREGEERTVTLPEDGGSWASKIRGGAPDLSTGVTLGDACERISCGVATGADKIFVMDEDELPEQLEEWTYPTASGKQLRLNDGPKSGQVFVCPYYRDGRLVPEEELDEFGEWASIHETRLKDRSCFKEGKRPWYGWHENPPMSDILQPKILCKDVTEEPQFWKDKSGEVVPRHSVYYLIPRDGVDIGELQEYLNSGDVQAWLEANCQRAANGFLRLQSTVLKKLPVPEEFGETKQTKLQ